MAHRYLNPHWWALRLSPILRPYVPATILLAAIGKTSAFGQEKEVSTLGLLADPNRTAIDVGAAYGLYTWHLARICKRCVAFEANPDSAGILRSGAPEAEVHACALSDREGTTKLRIPMKAKQVLTGYATIEPGFSAIPDDELSEFREIEVQTYKLDSFEIENVGFIKIDVEGHELAVLKGAQETILRDRPRILVELSSSHSTPISQHPAIEWLSERGYKLSDFDTSPQNFLFEP